MKKLLKDNIMENENAVSNKKINIEINSDNIAILNEEENKKNFKIKIIIAVLYYILIISTEFLYRKKLFSKSIELDIIPFK